MMEKDTLELKKKFDNGYTIEFQDGYTNGNIIEFVTNSEVILMNYITEEEFALDLHDYSLGYFNYYK
jgi:hypothetical protein